MVSIAQSWLIIERVLWENAHSIYRALRKPARNASLNRLTNHLPTKLPRDFVQSLRIHDGLSNSYLGQIRLFDYYALLPVSAILAEYKMLCGLQYECGFGGSQAKGDPAIRNDAHWRPGWVPILDADGDKLILDLDPAPRGVVGQVFAWSNTGSTPNRVLASSFGEWLGELAEVFRKRRFKLDEFGGIWFRQQFETGQGDYAQARHKWVDRMTLEELRQLSRAGKPKTKRRKR